MPHFDLGFVSAPSMLISRLVLNLRTYKQSSRDEFQSRSLRPINFAPASSQVFGNIGAPLDHDQWTSRSGNLFEDEVEHEMEELSEATDSVSAVDHIFISIKVRSQRLA